MLADYTRTGYLAVLAERAAELAGRLTEADPSSAAVAARRREALLATLQLDGSPLTAWPSSDLHETAGLAPPPDGSAPQRSSGGWFDAMRAFDEVPDAALLAREALGVQAADASDDLAGELAAAPAQALAELHRRLTVGLVAPDHAGRLRRSDQAVHDASIGRILYFTVEPDQLAAAFAALTAWLAGPAGALPPLFAAGVLHLELLRLHPFEAANGRLARAAARLWLRHHGLDPAGLSAPEPALARDPLGYHEEVARTLRRRDATVWLERWTEAVVDGLQASAHALGRVPGTGDVGLPAGLGEQFTLAEAREQLGIADLAAARMAVERLADGGALVRVPGSRGLRFRRRPVG